MGFRFSHAKMTIGSLAAIVATSFMAASAAAIEAPAGLADSGVQATDASTQEADFWFEAPSGTRTFTVEKNVIVPHIKDTDRLALEGNLINVYDPSDGLVASITADLSEGMRLREANGVIYVGSEDGTASRCIGNKWVALGVNIAADGLVCAPLGAATGGAGGFACGAAVATGVTAASC